MNLNEPDYVIDDMMKIADNDGNNTISFKEFVKAVSNY